MRSSRAAVAVVVALVAMVLAVPAQAAEDDTITFTGRGWGHGRGMGQYGALGYAVDHGWSSAQVLDHFYGGTRAGSVAPSRFTVELTAWRDRPALISGGGLDVNGVPFGSGALQLVREGAAMRLLTAPGCGGPWTAGPVVVGDAVVTASTGVSVCEVGRTRGYRGALRVVAGPWGGLATVNELPVEAYLRGVVPQEMSASWASIGGGRGAQALQAQAVAARSYALASRYAAHATTCDTTACQVYSGAFVRSQTTGAVTWLEDSRTDAAVAATAGLVRLLPSGAVARTEFSSSTGGWSAGGAFPAVQDLGDATSANPNRTWSTSSTRSRVAAALGLPGLDSLRVTSRNGLGADGGRVLEVAATYQGRTTVLSGATVRSRLGLKSDWFTVSDVVDPAAHQAVVTALWTDLLGRAPSAGELSQRTGELGRGRTVASLATEVARSPERAQRVVSATYQSALGRTPSPGESAGWVDLFRAYGSVPQMQSGILASQEAWNLSGGDAGRWVDLLYRTTLGRGASADEQAYWAARLQTSDRYQVAVGIAGSWEAAQIRLDGYYQLLLGRPRDPASVGWVPRMLLEADGDITVPAAVAGSLEYYLRAGERF